MPNTLFHKLFFHGGNINAAREYFKDAPDNWLDLSTGISPWAYLDEINIKPEIFSHLKTLPQYSDIKELEKIAAKYFGVDCDEIIAVSGSDSAIRILGKILNDVPQNILVPIFSGHKKSFLNAKHINLMELENVNNEYVIFANPNNPDCRLLGREYLINIMNKNNIKFIFDEAFMDYFPNATMVNHRGDGVVLRSFGKFFGLAGLRLGFVIANRNLINEIAQLIGDWPISSIAVEIGKMAYNDNNWHIAQRQRISETSHKLENLFRQYGIEIIGNAGQFITIQTDGAMQLFEILGRNAILCRPFDYAPKWLRFGLPKTPDDFTRLEKSLALWVNIKSIT